MSVTLDAKLLKEALEASKKKVKIELIEEALKLYQKKRRYDAIRDAGTIQEEINLGDLLRIQTISYPLQL